MPQYREVDRNITDCSLGTTNLLQRRVKMFRVLLYGTTLKLPGEFFIDTPTQAAANPSTFVEQLKENMKKLRLVPATDHSSADNIFVHPALNTCTHVFLRYDATRRPLQPPYTGPHKVVKR